MNMIKKIERKSGIIAVFLGILFLAAVHYDNSILPDQLMIAILVLSLWYLYKGFYKSLLYTMALSTFIVLFPYCTRNNDLEDMLEISIWLLILFLPVLAAELMSRYKKKKVTDKLKKGQFIVAAVFMTVLILTLIFTISKSMGIFAGIRLLILLSLVILAWYYTCSLNTADEHTKKRVRINLWFLNLMIAYFMLLVYSEHLVWYQNKWVISYMVMVLAPVFYFIVFRKADEYTDQYRKNRALIITMKYFAIGLLFYGYATALLFNGSWNGFSSWKPDIGAYYIILSVVIYLCEMREVQKKEGDGKKIIRAFMTVLYVLVCLVLTFLGNIRLRLILFDIGGPSVNLHTKTRVDWIAYRVAALKYYLTGGNMEAFNQLENMTNHEGIIWHTSDSFSVEDFCFNHGWWWLIIAFLVILILCLFLLKKKWATKELSRISRILAFSYILRAVITTVLCLFVFEDVHIVYPFFSVNAVADYMILILLFLQNRKENHREIMRQDSAKPVKNEKGMTFPACKSLLWSLTLILILITEAFQVQAVRVLFNYKTEISSYVVTEEQIEELTPYAEVIIEQMEKEYPDFRNGLSKRLGYILTTPGWDTSLSTENVWKYTSISCILPETPEDMATMLCIKKLIADMICNPDEANDIKMAGTTISLLSSDDEERVYKIDEYDHELNRKYNTYTVDPEIEKIVEDHFNELIDKSDIYNPEIIKAVVTDTIHFYMD